MTAVLHARARKIRERSTVLAWEYRQRKHTKGMWFRLRQALVGTAEAWIVDVGDGEHLAAKGIEPLPVGAEMAPPKRLFVVSAEMLAELASRRRVPVSLNAEFLEARDVALVLFPASG